MTLQELLIEEVGFIVIPHFLVVHSQHIRKTRSHLTALVHIGPVEHFRPILTGICRLAKQTHRIVIFTLGKCIGHFRKQLICRLSPDRQRTHQEQGEKQR